MHLDQLRQKYLNMPQYNYDATIREDLFTDKEISEIEKYGNWFHAIWTNQVPLTTSKLKIFMLLKVRIAKAEQGWSNSGTNTKNMNFRSDNA